MKNNFNYFKKPVKVLKVLANLKFSLMGFLFIKIGFQKSNIIQVKNTSCLTSYSLLSRFIHEFRGKTFWKVRNLSKLVRPDGFEPSTYGLKGSCSTAELRSLLNSLFIFCDFNSVYGSL